jgi:hypothetical protein
MQHEWYSGATILVHYDDAAKAVVVLARNGKVPPLSLPAPAFVDATAVGARLELVGAFGDDTKIALKLATSNDAVAIARVLREQLALPREPAVIAVDAVAQAAEGAYVAIEGRCFPFANGPLMENRIALIGAPIQIEHQAPYRATGFLRGTTTQRPALHVLQIEHLNPPVTWLAGGTVQVIYAPHRNLIGFAPQKGHRFVEPVGTLELWLPRDTLVSVALAGHDQLVFEGDLQRTGYGTSVTLGPVSADDARQIFLLLDEHLQLPRSPQPMTPEQAAALVAPALVMIEGTFKRGHIEGPNFDAGLQVRGPALEPDRRYRITGFLYPRFKQDGSFIGYTGPRITPLTVERLS